TGTVIAPGSSGKAVIVRNGTFFNYGLVQGAISGISVSPTTTANGAVTSKGTVIGATGISVTAGTLGQTLTVTGTVIGNAGTAISLSPGGRDRLIVQPGVSFTGTVDGGKLVSGGSSVLEITAAGGAGVASGAAAGAAAAGGA